MDILGRHRLVESVSLFDVYTGNNIPDGTKSLALHLYFPNYAKIVLDKTELGVVGEIHPEVRDKFGLKPQPVVLFELQLEQLLKASQVSGGGFEPLSHFPAATREMRQGLACCKPCSITRNTWMPP